MKRLAALGMAILLTEAMVTAQAETRAHTRPAVPTQEALAPLNLKLGWRAYLPVDEIRDGIATVQLFGNRLLVQLRSGAILALNADTGETLWQAAATPYGVSHALAGNYHFIVGYDNASVFALDRNTGAQLWKSDLPNAPSAAPAADVDAVYVPLSGNHVLCYRLPPPKGAEGPGPDKTKDKGGASDKDRPGMDDARKPGYTTSSTGSPSAGGQASRSEAERFKLPVKWDLTTTGRVEYPPLLVRKTEKHPGYLLMPGADGLLSVGYKEPRGVVYNVKAERPITAPMGQHGSVAYVGTQDNMLLALDIEGGKVLWRLAVGGPVLSRPEATDEDVYVAGSRNGLCRIKRTTGDLLWRHGDAERFLAANKKWVYALDRTNNLLVLDRARGTRQAKLDLRGFTYPVGNDQTDRIFLAANDGLLICLYDRDQPQPLWNKTVVDERPEAPKAKPGEPKVKPPEPKKEDGMEKKDKMDKDKMDKKD